MADWPITRAHVEAFLGVPAATEPDGAALDLAAAAAVAWVDRHVLDSPDDQAPAAVGADVHLGTAMLAARWYGRRTSTQGVASFGEFGVSYVARQDPDVARLLGLGAPGVA